MLTSEPLPSWRTGAAVVRAALEALRPPRRMTVSQAAERYRMLKTAEGGVGYQGPWRNSMAPHLVEPMDRALLRSVSVVVLMGPSQFGKSEVFLNLILHAVVVRPGDILLYQPNKEAAADFMSRRVERGLIRSCREVAEQLGPTRSDDTVSEKTFRSGMVLSVLWPSAVNMSSKPAPLVLIDERDRMADNIDGEGDPVELGKRRFTTFGRDGSLVVASSPSRTNGTGVIALYRSGDQNIIAWPCAHCGEHWTPGFDAERKPTLEHLHYPAGATADEAREAAVLICPHCGGEITERERVHMIQAATWLPHGMTIDADGRLVGARPAGRVASYWLHGFANPFKQVGEIAGDLVAALEHFDATGDEQPLKTVTNTVLGIPYKSQAAGAPLEAEQLAERREGYELGTVPAGVRVLVAAVDVQGNRFEVLVVGFSETGESWLVDRFAIRQLADGRTDIRPGEFPEHWAVLLERVVAATYPLADDPSQVLGIATTAVDTGGVDGVTAAAAAFWRLARRSGVADLALTLVKGSNNAAAPILAPKPTYLEALPSGKPDEGGPRLWMIGVSHAKDMLANRLRRREAGPGAVHFPHGLADGYLAELVAETKEKGKWVKLQRANETWDLLVYATAAFARLRPGRVDWRRPPKVAMPRPRALEPAAPAPLPAIAAYVAPAGQEHRGRRRGLRGGVRA